MNRNRIVALVLILALVCLGFAGCAAREWSTSQDGYKDVEEMPDGAQAEEVIDDRGAGGYSAERFTLPEGAGQKLVYIANLSTETYEFDKDYTEILGTLKNMGGHVSSLNLSGVEEDNVGSYGRSAEMTLSVPSDRLDDFLYSVEQKGTLLSKDMNVVDRADQSSSLDAHIKTLEGRHTKLEELYKKAEKIEDILKIERELSDVTDELEAAKFKKKSLETRVTYSTVNLDLQERIEETEIKIQKESLSKRSANAFARSLRTLGEFFEGLIVVLVGLSPILVVLAVAGGAAIAIVKIVKKRKSKKMEQNNVR